MDENVVKKIRKCLALSASSNEHEAAAALRQAQKLMAAYNITAEAIAGAEIGEGAARSTACTKPPLWEKHLASMLCDAFGCECIVHLGWFNKVTNSNGALAEYVYIGIKHQAMLAGYAHNVLRRQILREKAKFMAEWEKSQWRPTLKERLDASDTFCRAFVARVSDKVVSLSVEPSQKDAIKKRKKDLLASRTIVKTKAATRGFDTEAYMAGSTAGSQADLHRPMQGGAETLKLSSN